MAENLSVVIVDDSALYRLMLRDVLGEIPGVTVIGNANCGTAALEKIAELKPDVITLDVEMPDISGIEVLREMTRRSLQSRVIMVSRLTEQGARVTTEALLEGAFDFVLKPAGPDRAENRQQLKLALIEKLEAIALAARKVLGQARRRSLQTSAVAGEKDRFDAVLIGTSTGGPEALRTILPLLPWDFPLPVLVVQHMPPQYTKSLAARLDSLSPLNVIEAQHGEPVEAGTIYLAPGGRHMEVKQAATDRVVVRLTDDPPVNASRPAVDVLFRSAAEVYGARALAVILTGMGRDGAAGCRLLRERGCRVIAQHHEGCVVYGMPKAVVDEGLDDLCLPLSQIAGAILRETGRPAAL